MQALRTTYQKTNAELHAFAGRVDGLQYSGDEAESHRHLSNALLNIMRGGIPLDGYTIRRNDFFTACRKIETKTALERTENGWKYSRNRSKKVNFSISAGGRVVKISIELLLSFCLLR